MAVKEQLIKELIAQEEARSQKCVSDFERIALIITTYDKIKNVIKNT